MAHWAQSLSYGPSGPITFIATQSYDFSSHSIELPILPIMGPTAHRAHLAHYGPVGQYTAQVHGIAYGPSNNISVSFLQVFAHSQDYCSQTFGFSAFRDLLVYCVCAVYVHTW